MRKIVSLVVVCTMIMTILSGCALLDKFGIGSKSDDGLTPVSSVTMGEDEANNLKDKSPIQLYFVNEQGNKLAAETRYISIDDTKKGNDFLATVVVKELINGPAKGSTLKASIPAGTVVHSPVVIKNGIATVDLSKEFIDKHPGGKKQEQLTLYSVVNSLTEIKDIKSVQFKIDGKVTKEFKGNYQIDIAYPRSAFLISAQPTTVSGDNAAATDSTKKDSTKKDSTKKDETKKDSESKSAPVEPVKKDSASDTGDVTKDQKASTGVTDKASDVETNVEVLE